MLSVLYILDLMQDSTIAKGYFGIVGGEEAPLFWDNSHKGVTLMGGDILSIPLSGGAEE